MSEFKDAWLYIVSSWAAEAVSKCKRKRYINESGAQGGPVLQHGLRHRRAHTSKRDVDKLQRKAGELYRKTEMTGEKRGSGADNGKC